MRQFKDLIRFIKGLSNNQSKKRVVENAVIIIIIGIIVIIAGGSLFKKSTPAKDKPKGEPITAARCQPVYFRQKIKPILKKSWKHYCPR
jgi:hypothetical protein